MASLLNAIAVMQQIGFYAVIFPFLLIFAVMYGILLKTKVFGDNKTVNVLVSIIVAFIFVSFSQAVSFVNYLIPFIIAFLIAAILMLLIFTFMGAKEESIVSALNHPMGYLLIIGIFIIIIMVVINMVLPELSPYTATNMSEAGAPTGTTAVMQSMATLFHPTFLAIMIMFLIFAVAAYIITTKVEK